MSKRTDEIDTELSELTKEVLGGPSTAQTFIACGETDCAVYVNE